MATRQKMVFIGFTFSYSLFILNEVKKIMNSIYLHGFNDFIRQQILTSIYGINCIGTNPSTIFFLQDFRNNWFWCWQQERQDWQLWWVLELSWGSSCTTAVTTLAVLRYSSSSALDWRTWTLAPGPSGPVACHSLAMAQPSCYLWHWSTRRTGIVKQTKLQAKTTHLQDKQDDN